jgi:anti-sigma B factor antagonist
MEGIQVSTEIAGSANQISIIRVGGYIDTTTSSELERALDTLLKQKRYNIVVDLGNVDYISSAGWGIFISEIKSIRENNGDLKLVKMIPDVYEIFELLEFHHILDVYDTLEEALGTI